MALASIQRARLYVHSVEPLGDGFGFGVEKALTELDTVVAIGTGADALALVTLAEASVRVVVVEVEDSMAVVLDDDLAVDLALAAGLGVLDKRASGGAGGG